MVILQFRVNEILNSDIWYSLDENINQQIGKRLINYIVILAHKIIIVRSKVHIWDMFLTFTSDFNKITKWNLFIFDLYCLY